MERLIDIFGRRVRTLRKSKGMTLEQLATSADVGYKHVAEIERGAKVPSFEMIERLAQALSVDAYELFLPGSLVGIPVDQNLRLLMRDVDRHGSAGKKKFLAEILIASRHL